MRERDESVGESVVLLLLLLPNVALGGLLSGPPGITIGELEEVEVPLTARCVRTIPADWRLGQPAALLSLSDC